MSRDSYFRGYKSVREVMARVEPLAAWTRQYKPEQTVLTLARKDFDLLMRWPNAALCFHVMKVGETLRWGTFELRADASKRRYNAPPRPVTESLIKGDTT